MKIAHWWMSSWYLNQLGDSRTFEDYRYDNFYGKGSFKFDGRICRIEARADAEKTKKEAARVGRPPELSPVVYEVTIAIPDECFEAVMKKHFGMMFKPFKITSL